MKEKKDFFHTVYDCVIENGTVIDPKTELRTIGNVAILNGKIAGVTRARLSAKRKIDASGKIVCPGIVDPHSHADGQLFSGYVMASMGVTTIIVGSCGLGPYPVKEFLTGLDETGYPLNTAALTPQSWILREKRGLKVPIIRLRRSRFRTWPGGRRRICCKGLSAFRWDWNTRLLPHGKKWWQWQR